MKLSKKLTVTIVSQILTSTVLVANKALDLGLSEEVQLALVGSLASSIVAYLAAQGVVDMGKAKNGGPN